MTDNCPPAAAGADALHPVFTRGFPEYSQHSGFIVDPARVRHPTDKPKVERGVQYVRERLFKGGDFDGLPQLRTKAQRWSLETAGTRTHGATRWQPLSVFQDEERNALMPWDGEPCEITHWRTAKVHPDHHAACQYALWPAPASISHRVKLVRVHQRQPRGGSSTGPEDYPAEHTACTMKAPERIKRAAVQQGPAVSEFAGRLFEGPRLGPGSGRPQVPTVGQAPHPPAPGHRLPEGPGRGPHRYPPVGTHPGAGPQEALPQPPPPMPVRRFARPGSVFAHSTGGRS